MNAAGVTGLITLTSGQNDPTNDAGVTLGASLGDIVFSDTDNDGIQDAGEAGVGGVTVQLLDDAGTVINTTTTAADGSYNFSGLAAGTYQVQFVLPAGFTTFSPQNVGGDDTVDSDVTAIGLSDTVTLAANEVNNTIDAGLPPAASVGNFVFQDNEWKG